MAPWLQLCVIMKHRQIQTLASIMTSRKAAYRGKGYFNRRLDKVLEKGAVLDGEIAIRVADVDLIFIGLKLLITSISRAEVLRRARRILPRERLAKKMRSISGVWSEK